MSPWLQILLCVSVFFFFFSTVICASGSPGKMDRKSLRKNNLSQHQCSKQLNRYCMIPLTTERVMKCLCLCSYQASRLPRSDQNSRKGNLLSDSLSLSLSENLRDTINEGWKTNKHKAKRQRARRFQAQTIKIRFPRMNIVSIPYNISWEYQISLYYIWLIWPTFKSYLI